MTITKFKVSGKEFVVVPREEYDRFAALMAQEKRDVARAKRALEKFRAGKLKTIPHKRVKQILGL